MIMLHQISWFTYVTTILFIAAAYYAYVGLSFYRAELRNLLFRLTGRQPAAIQLSGSDLPLPAQNIAGAIKPEYTEFVAQEELSFGPPDEPEEQYAARHLQVVSTSAPATHLLGEFSEMISETKTLIRVINESSETKENFGMLFRLIVQKYPALTGTTYETQVNDYLISEGADQFPFPLTLAELESYWSGNAEKQ